MKKKKKSIQSIQMQDFKNNEYHNTKLSLCHDLIQKYSIQVHNEQVMNDINLKYYEIHQTTKIKCKTSLKINRGGNTERS